MLEKLEQIEARYEELSNELSSPELLSNQAAYTKAAKQHRSLGEIVEKYRSWKSLKEELTGARELFDTSDDDEMREMAFQDEDTAFGSTSGPPAFQGSVDDLQIDLQGIPLLVPAQYRARGRQDKVVHMEDRYVQVAHGTGRSYKLIGYRGLPCAWGPCERHPLAHFHGNMIDQGMHLNVLH